MLMLPEYISKRMKQDEMDVLSIQQRSENIRTCTNYIFDYFNAYLTEKRFDEQTITEDNRVEHYKRQIMNYSYETQEWLISIYKSSGKYLERFVKKTLDPETYFLLSTSEREFGAAVHKCSAATNGMFPNLELHTEQLMRFIKEYKNRINNNFWSRIEQNQNILPCVDNWIVTTLNDYDVNLIAFCRQWLDKWSHNHTMWPINTRHTTKEVYGSTEKPIVCFSHHYIVQKDVAPFGINTFYNNMPSKPFMKGRKKELEILLMYLWMVQNEKNMQFWEQYIKSNT